MENKNKEKCPDPYRNDRSEGEGLLIREVVCEHNNTDRAINVYQ